MKTLVIAEKPSVAQDIVRAMTPTAGKFEKHDEYFESDDWLVTSAVGHLVEIQAPEEFDVKRGKWSFANLPVIPPYFDLKPMDKTKTRLNAIVKLTKRKDVGALVNACDAGREGELIFRLIQQYAKSAHPVKRLWLQSMTPAAIREGFDSLRTDAQMLPLADAARCRSEADWMVGINGTRAMTAFNSRDGGFFLTTVGRVQTPTLSVVVEREEKIRKFVSRDYWEIHASFLAEAGEYPAKWFDPKWKKAAANADNTEPDAELKADRVWSEREALAIAEAVRGKAATVTEESKPTTQAAGLLFDLTSLQREANGKFGFSAKTTLSIAQSLYERHKALTYPRTDSRALPEDYVPVVKQTFEMLAASSMKHLAPHAATALKGNYIKPSKRIFDNSKVSDHFAIIPTLQAPSGLSDAEQKLYDLVVRRFMAVFFPSAEYLVTTRISQAVGHSFKTEGKVLVKPGWLAIYGKEAADEVADAKEGDKGQSLVPVKPGEMVRAEVVEAKGLKTRPPARYSEATLLGAMEGAGKTIDDDELREAMQEKGLGTPATRAATIEGLINEKYMLREGRELIPTAKAFQLMTLLRGLGVEELSRADLTGEWEYKLAQMEHGKLSRETFMAEIAAMTKNLVDKAKGYDKDTIPGDYATLSAPCPNCGGVIKENYRRYTCTGKNGAEGCGFSFGKTPAGRTFEVAEVEQFLRDKRIGPLDGFRSKAGWPFTAEMVIKFDEETKNYKLEFDFGDDKAGETGEIVDFSAQQSLGACPKCGAGVFEHGKNYVCEKSVPTNAQPTPSCDFKTGQMILQQPVEREQMVKLLTTGKTDLLDKFVSMRTRRPFKAMLAWDAEAGKVNFEFAPSKFPPRKTAGPPRTGTVKTPFGKTVAAKTAGPAAKKAAAKKVAAKKAPAAKTAKPKVPRVAKPGSGLKPSDALAAVIGSEPVARTQVIKKLWDYIKAEGLQDAANKRAINADAKLLAVFGKPQVTMFELAGIVGKHLTAE
ncbi:MULTISPECIES: DNA topoisomerase III [unclassified Polaromonas]|jgi:DNA topoisomerase-3|uniref:DNA topoisomerase III n=1 Tax=unclassified Polaromonas TaxID=2638319 RepID=UPI000BC85A84|nr:MULTISPECIES: DNA topoisomerase III [unclassified Polaromonas]OYY38530.1 MAG: DNA topoisomerase III [Polaromonas sp. 35-63-35]OYZ21312.1 MAG: DNA topoisomerase III [Polaromonas sp. 16-63-31]OYZ79068.1 MAG: DNA topoisomerase III [Polaromonas sp. 24-63-21]OZA50268.1 MAG: DNA topoisomerase III [Polaromonas sp. 17-63-33]OZA89236.1 MAG: DNA topoisomerase III [Polaromonas sp. 39-63-25]